MSKRASAKNNSENFIAIGDIHGRFDLLDQLLDMISLRADLAGNYTLAFLGDLIDRGSDSFKVVERVKNLCDTGVGIAVRGNHEDMMIDYWNSKRNDPYNVWMWNGGSKTMKSYENEMRDFGVARFFSNAFRCGHIPWLKSLPYFYETEKVFFSHAPVPIEKYRTKEDFRMDVNALTWSFHGNHNHVTEDEFAMDMGKLAVCGHVHALREGILTPRVYPHVIYADTGCGCADWGPLTGIIIEDGKFKDFIQAVPETTAPTTTEANMKRS